MPRKPSVRLAAPASRKQPARPQPNVKAIAMANPSRRQKPKSIWSNFIYLAVIIGLLFGLLPTALVLVVGGLPTLVTLVTDRHPRHYLARCVGFLNFAGVIPYLIKIWMHHTTLAAMQMLTDPFVWLVMYGAAAIGWIFYLSAPSIAWLQVELTGARRVRILKARQRRLVEEWGEEVAVGAPGTARS
jgi:hypothetical protein